MSSSLNDRMYQAFGAEIRHATVGVATGQSLIITVPNNEIWEVMNISAHFVTSSTVATRRLCLFSKTDTADDLMLRNSPVTQAASENKLYYFNLGGTDETAFGAFDAIGLVLPYTLLLPGYTLQFNAQNLQGTDQISASYNYRLMRTV